MGRAFAALIFTLVSFSVLACGGDSSPSNDGSTDATNLVINQAPTPIRVSAEALQSEKESNEVAWENIYNDNIALISGTISSIAEAGNNYDVKLETDNFTVDVVCKLEKSDEATVLSLRQGQTISVVGRVTDDGIIDIVVKDCSIASSSGASQSGGQATTPATAAETAAPPAPTAAVMASPPVTLAPTAQPATKPKPRWDVHMAGDGDLDGGYAGTPLLLIAGWSGSGA